MRQFDAMTNEEEALYHDSAAAQRAAEEAAESDRREREALARIRARHEQSAAIIRERLSRDA